MATQSAQRDEGVCHWSLLRNAANPRTDVHRCGLGNYIYRQSTPELRADLHHKPPDNARNFLRCLQVGGMAHGDSPDRSRVRGLVDLVYPEP